MVLVRTEVQRIGLHGAGSVRRRVNMRALEVGGRLDEKRHLVLDEALPVREIIPFDEEELPEPLWFALPQPTPPSDS